MLTDTEIAAMKERQQRYQTYCNALCVMPHEIGGYQETVERIIKDAQSLLLEREELLKDKERLDWVLEHRTLFYQQCTTVQDIDDAAIANVERAKSVAKEKKV